MSFRKTSKVSSKIFVLKTAAFLVAFYFLLHLSLAVYIERIGYSATTKQSEVAIILGTGPNLDGPSPCLVARVIKGKTLLKNGVVKRLIFSGGKVDVETESEASVMKSVAISQGIREKDFLLENQSGNTYENLVNSQAILKKENIGSVVIVSDPHQLPRAAMVAKKLRLSYSLSPVLDSPCSTQLHNRLRYLIFEPLKIIDYFVLGRI